MIIYLHGFRSSPASGKVRLLAQRMDERGLADRFCCEPLPVGPKQAVESVERAIVGAASPPLLAGSSLGGFYATYLAEKHDLRAVLINPAVDAHLVLAANVGPQTNLYTGESFEFTTDHITQLADMAQPRIARPGRFWVLLETGDEVLDYRKAVLRYAGARQTVIEGGDHSFRHFADYIDEIIDWSLTG
jgi:predicted esterase YcpF (UPF0227 family)